MPLSSAHGSQNLQPFFLRRPMCVSPLRNHRFSTTMFFQEISFVVNSGKHIGLLKKHGCKFWDPWADESGMVPSAYGNFWRHFPVHDIDGRAAFRDQLRWVVEELQRNPMSRRLVVTSWAPGNAQASRLPPY